jgi:hypothetical protein
MVKIKIKALIVFTMGVIIFSFTITSCATAHHIPDDIEIFKLIYGNNVSIQESGDEKFVYIEEELSPIEREQFNYASQIITRIVRKIKGWDQDSNKILVLTQSGPPSCCDRSQVPVLGGVVLVSTGDTWQVESFRKLITPFGGIESLEALTIEVIAPQKTVLVLSDAMVRDSVVQTWDLLIAEIQGNLKLIARIETGANNLDSCSVPAENEQCWSYSAAYEFVPCDNLDDEIICEFCDIVITTVGTKIIEGELVSFEDTSRLVYTNGEYRSEGH